jgi:hypothetical protein
MSYYLLKTEDGQAITLTTQKLYNEQEVVTICNEVSNKELSALLRSLQMVGICRCFTLSRPRFAYTILLKNNGEIKVERHPEFRIVTFGEKGNLIRVESKTYESKEDAQERLEKLQEVYVTNLFIAEK